MLRLLKNYLLDFWIWWYIVNAKAMVMNLLRVWGFTLAYFNIVPMVKNIFVPLYQDFTIIGKMISFPIRVTWIFVGSFLQFLVTIPLAIYLVIYFFLPVLPVVIVVRYFLHL